MFIFVFLVLFIILGVVLILSIVSKTVITMVSNTSEATKKINITVYIRFLILIAFVLNLFVIINQAKLDNKKSNIQYNPYVEHVQAYVKDGCQEEYDNGYLDCIEDVFNGTLSVEDIMNGKSNKDG